MEKSTDNGTAIIKAVRKNGRTTISNDRGDKWSCLGNMPERYSIAALVSFTLCERVGKIACVSDNFEIEMRIKILDRE